MALEGEELLEKEQNPIRILAFKLFFISLLWVLAGGSFYHLSQVREHSYLWNCAGPSLPSPLPCYGSLTALAGGSFYHLSQTSYKIDSESWDGEQK